MGNSEISKSTTKSIYCNKCKGFTNHNIIGEHHKYEEEIQNKQIIYYEEWIYRLWICAGCESGTLERAWSSSGMYDEDGQQIYDSDYFPNREYRNLLIKEYKQLPPNLSLIYFECIKSYNFDLKLLCAGGLRALIEGICQDKKIKGDNLEERINGLTVILPVNIVESLHGFRFLGNLALHELKEPSMQTLKVAIDVCEDILNFIYELDYKAKLLPKKDRKEK